MTRIARISFSCHLMKPDEPDGWRNDYLVGLVYLVINSKKGRRYHNGCPSKTTK